MIWLALLLTTASAHRPSFGDADMGSAESAYVIEDIDISIVVYKELVCDDPELWMSFDGLSGDELFAQLGVPEIDRLRDHRPAMAVLAPGLPPLEEDVPFDVPEGLGGYVFHATGEPAEFYEPFTQTESWIWAEERITLPEDGIGYVVGYQPDDVSGKIWLATGEVEDFEGIPTSEFAEWGPIVRDFHEVDEFERPLSYTEEECSVEPIREEEGCGCSSGAAGWAGLFVLPLLVLRRSRAS